MLLLIFSRIKYAHVLSKPFLFCSHLSTPQIESYSQIKGTKVSQSYFSPEKEAVGVLLPEIGSMGSPA